MEHFFFGVFFILPSTEIILLCQKFNNLNLKIKLEATKPQETSATISQPVQPPEVPQQMEQSIISAPEVAVPTQQQPLAEAMPTLAQSDQGITNGFVETENTPVLAQPPVVESESLPLSSEAVEQPQAEPPVQEQKIITDVPIVEPTPTPVEATNPAATSTVSNTEPTAASMDTS